MPPRGVALRVRLRGRGSEIAIAASWDSRYLRGTMPRRELRSPGQIEDWLREWGTALSGPGGLVLIGSAGLLWHAARRGLDAPLTDNSMDADPVTDDEEVAELAYDCLIGSEFELKHGWHVNLMPKNALRELPDGWESRSASRTYGNLTVRVPSPADLLAPKLRRGEPRDRSHLEWAIGLGLVSVREAETLAREGE